VHTPAIIVINSLIADTVELSCKKSATLRIKNITANAVKLDDENSANLSKITDIMGNVINSSYACFAGTLSGRDDVTAGSGSTWTLGSCA
jgi:uncharacterized membrane protein